MQRWVEDILRRFLYPVSGILHPARHPCREPGSRHPLLHGNGGGRGKACLFPLVHKAYAPQVPGLRHRMLCRLDTAAERHSGQPAERPLFPWCCQRISPGEARAGAGRGDRAPGMVPDYPWQRA